MQSYLVQSIELTEAALNPGVDRKLLEELLTLNLVKDRENDKGPRNLTEDEENEFFALLQAPG